MFRKVLIANRGEIAVRIIRACRELGIAAVAVYSEADAESLHVRLADEAVCIGPAASSQSYLNIEAVVSAALSTKAEAVHPGYGFLAENAAFARAVATAGLTFIGPPAEAMEIMGSKTSARRAAVEAGVPIVPGTVEALQSFAEAKKTAEEFGYPVMLKAAAGGGGKGMRLVSRLTRTSFGVRDCANRGGGGVRRFVAVPGEGSRETASHRDPGLCRQSRQRGPPG